MPNLIIALIVVFGGIWLIRKFAKTSPSQAAGLTRKLAGGGLIALSGLLALRGLSQFAVPLFAVGLGMIGQSAVFPNGFPWSKKSEGQKSRVATGILAMELDHDSGRMTGRVISGPFKGASLEEMNSTNLQSLYDYCARASDQSISLLEAWLDRNKPEWRETWIGTDKARQAGTGAMSRDEALSVLGLKSGATNEDIKNAHRRLMKDFHPDRGGSDYLAAKINQAKDILIQD
ncbi:MAG TPA: DnaJ domain-containing protein [Aestuariivirga sp.]|nr:DnaJ domain-containing protein [Aestuariivirga sp.]